MTNNPTIDGVSRDTIRRALSSVMSNNTSHWSSLLADELRALLDAGISASVAPAVERQEPSAELFEVGEIINRIVMALPVKSSTTHFAPSRKYTLEDAKSHARLAFDRIVELADQQSTIAQLEDKLNKAIDLDFQRRETIARLEGKVQELESGRGEPVAYISETSLSFLHQRKEIANTSWRLNLATHVSGDETQPLFATNFNLPFAEKIISKLRRCEECFSDFESGGVDIGRHWLDLLTQLGLLNRVQRSPAMWEITQQGEDCLDAAAALNGPDK